MKLDDDITALQRSGADAKRVRIADGRTYNSFYVNGFGLPHLFFACLVGVGLAAGFGAFSTWCWGYTLATPNDEKILTVARAAGVEREVSAMSAGDLRARVLYEPAIVKALSGALHEGIGGIFYNAGKYLAQIPTDDGREHAARIFQQLAELGSENASRLENAWKWAEFAGREPIAANFALSLAEISANDKDRAETAWKIAKGVKPDAAANLRLLTENDPETIKSLASMNYSQMRTLRTLAESLGRNVSDESGRRLDAALTWLGDGKPLPKCDAVAPICSVNGTIYGVTCGAGTYVSIAPTCVYCPSGGTPQRQSDGTTLCNYRR